MATKKIRDITSEDVGRHVRYVDPNDGDTVSGELKSIHFYRVRQLRCSLQIDKMTLSIDPDDEIEVSEPVES